MRRCEFELSHVNGSFAGEARANTVCTVKRYSNSVQRCMVYCGYGVTRITVVYQNTEITQVEKRKPGFVSCWLLLRYRDGSNSNNTNNNTVVKFYMGSLGCILCVSNAMYCY